MTMDMHQCTHCIQKAYTRQDIIDYFGYRMQGGERVPSPICYSCKKHKLSIRTCHNCGKVLTKKNLASNFCSYACKQERREKVKEKRRETELGNRLYKRIRKEMGF